MNHPAVFRRHAWLALLFACACSKPAPLLQPRPATRVLFKGVRVLDTVAAQWLDGTRDVLAENGRITRVQPPGSDVTAEVIYTGGTLMPGFTDAHVHVLNGMGPPWKLIFPDEKRNLEAFVAAGITTVMDMGGLNMRAREHRDAPTPRVLAAGPIFTAYGGHPAAAIDALAPWLVARLVIPRFTRQLHTPADVAEPMAEVLAMNPDYIKIALDHAPSPSTPRLDVPTLTAVVEAAHKGGKKVFVHVGRSQDALDAVMAGADVLAHGVHLDALTDDALNALAAKKIPVVVTLSIFRGIERLGVPVTPLFSDMERRVAGDALIQAFRPLPSDPDPKMRQWILDITANRATTMENARRMYQRGVPILVGSDSANAGHIPGGSFHWELDLLVEAGIPPAVVLSQAARGNLAAWGGPLEAGEVTSGKPADLVWVPGDVARDFSAVHHVGAVMTQGTLWEPTP